MTAAALGRCPRITRRRAVRVL